MSSQGSETEYLKTATHKMGELLQKMYGAAGRDVISKNMRPGKAGEEANPMVPGVKRDFIFGFCDVRDFTSAVECLQEDTMIFTNLCGQIVHGIVHKFGGFANKNVGDAFMVGIQLPTFQLFNSRPQP